ncbi:penicillin-binding protein [Streptomyces sp. BR123]|uniref:transglycosylase domain-containing protein n=1 Tax=Streptomyces sp. BR123 TaxID=2749828 RepID=UPI0015C4C789|nr:transglycosylase domain-containing protein [Streptomyces sp. BR123]NXY93369.1 penicillin-binding protein [Streptomyces sp. BR123]
MGRAEARKAQQQRSARRAPRGRATGKGQAGKRTGIRRFFTWKTILGTLFGMMLLGMAALVGLYFYVDPPDPNATATAQSNTYKYADGTLMARVGEMNREIVPIEKVPKEIQTAFIAIENKSFYEDRGVDFMGVARGLVRTATGKGAAGGSTITQQYVKNFYLTQDQTATRKLKELVISLKVDQKMTKDQILAGYLNTSYFGRGAYGIQAASQAYYGVDVEKLTLEQGAYLAAVLQAPSDYDWATASQKGKELVTIRFNGVFQNMVEMGALDEAKRQTLKFQQPIQPKPAPGLEGQKGYLKQAADAELRRQTGMTAAELQAGGWEIQLNIDPKKQAALEKAVKDELESELDRKNRPVDAAVQAGATSVDPKTGAIVAMYGGTGLSDHWASNALRTDFQPGSTFKPVVLASALENKSTTQDKKPITPNALYDGTSKRPVVGSSIPFNPQNQDDKDYGTPLMTVQEATNFSVNSVYAQMIVDVKPPNAKKTALELGMKDRQGWPEDKPAMSLGTMSANTVEMAAVYATLDNHGKKVVPSIIKSAEHAEREFKKPESGQQVITRETADTVTKVLTGVVNEGSGKTVRSSAYEAAGKTGTTESNVAAWFTAYTPELVTVVAMFGEEPGTGKQTTLTGTAGGGRAGGSSFPAEIWKAYTLAALKGVSTAKFDLSEADMGPVQAPSRSSSPSASAATTSPSPSSSQTSPSPDPSKVSPNPDPSKSTGKPDPTKSSSTKPDPTKSSGTPPIPPPINNQSQ